MSGSPGPPREVFISFAHDDSAHVEPIVDVLRYHGIPCWVAPQQIRGSQDWHDEIGFALERCDWFIPFLTPRATRSRWVKREIIYAVIQERYDKRIVPVMLEPCDPQEVLGLSWVLSTIQHIEASASRDELCRQLLRVWGLGFSAKIG